MTRPTNKLTDAHVRGAKPADRAYKLSDGEGMFCEVTPSGSKRWRLKYRFAGKEKLLSLGTYPATSLQAARAKRDTARQQLDAGMDPSAERRREKAAQAAAAANSVEAVFHDWYETKHKAEVVPAHAERNKRRMERHVLPYLGKRAIAEVEPAEVLEVLRRVERHGTAETAKRVRTLLSQIWRFAVSTARADRDVTQDLRGALVPPKSRHFPALTDPGEVGALLRAIDSFSGTPEVRGALQLAPLVALRPGELRRLRWESIDWEKSRAAVTIKGGGELLVPLSDRALAILRDLWPLTSRSEFVFPSARGADRPMSDMAMTAALARLGYKDRHSVHGWRATLRTIAVETLGYPEAVVEMQLGHRVRDLHGTAYNRATWIAERQKLMQEYADHLSALRDDTGKVTALHQSA